MVVVQNKYKVEEIVNETIINYIESVANAYGVDIDEHEVDSGIVNHLKDTLFEAFEDIGVNIIKRVVI